MLVMNTHIHIGGEQNKNSLNYMYMQCPRPCTKITGSEIKAKYRVRAAFICLKMDNGWYGQSQ